MANVESCHNCVYARWDPGLWLRTLNSVFPARPVCGNHPDFPGRMKECPLGRVCNNFRARPPTPQGEAVKTISLGDGFVAYVDAADFDWLNQWTWYLGCGGYAYRLEKTKVILMHRQIMQPPKGLVVHHKNRNRLDNTRENMANVTVAENTRHRVRKRNCSSRFWGVGYIKSRRKYRVYVCCSGEHCFVGEFTDEIEAARAHDYKAVELKGEAARLNFPDEWPPERRTQIYATAEAKSARRKTTQRKTRDAKRKTKSTRATKKTRAETQGRRGGKGQKRAKPAKPRATRDERRATKQAKKSSRKTHNAKRKTKPKPATDYSPQRTPRAQSSLRP